MEDVAVRVELCPRQMGLGLAVMVIGGAEDALIAPMKIY
jgi:hypothetical protein